MSNTRQERLVLLRRIRREYGQICVGVIGLTIFLSFFVYRSINGGDTLELIVIASLWSLLFPYKVLLIKHCRNKLKKRE